MGNKKIALAYSIDNLPVAEAIAQALAPTNYAVFHYYCKKNGKEAPLSEQLRDFNGTILLLISDNFLKSVHCMNRALQLVQLKGTQMLPVVIDGRVKDEATQQYVQVPTKFERIGDIIPYINYWQNQYLDLRSQKRRIESADDFEKDALNEHLRILRQVSSEASEFLRVLRNMKYLQFDDFIENHLQALFQFLEDEEEWTSFKAKTPFLKIEVKEDFIPSALEEGEKFAESLQKQEANSAATPSSEIVILPPIDPKEEPIPAHVEEEKAPVAVEPLAIESFGTIGKVIEANAITFAPPVTTNGMGVNGTTISELDHDVPTPPIDTPTPPSTSNELPPLNEESEAEIKEKIGDLLRQARGLVSAGQVEAGLNFMKLATRQYPGYPELHYAYGYLLAQNTNDLDAAANQLDMALSVSPTHEPAHFLLAELAELRQDFASARSHYEQVAATDPNFPDVFYRLGSLIKNHFPTEQHLAAKYFEQATQQAPQNVDAHYQYGILLNEVVGDYQKARDFFLATLTLQPKHPFAHYDLAILYHQQGDLSKAHDEYQAAIAINPELQTPDNDLAFQLPAPVITPPIITPAEITPTIITPTTTTPILPMTEAVTTSSSPVANLGNQSNEQDTIELLRQNLLRLEEMLSAKAQAEPAKVEPPKPEPKTVFITGASSGIGYATAHLFASHGHRVIINGRRAENLATLEHEIKEQYQTDVLVLPFDVTDNQGMQTAIAHMPEEWHNIDILINNAGKAKGLNEIQDGLLEHWEEMIDTNIKGLLYLTRVVASFMVAQEKGHIINIGSIAGKEAYAKGNVYCATKAAVDMLTKTMRLDLHKYNIRVSQVAPGAVEETEFSLVRYDGDAEKAAKTYDDFMPLQAKDVAETIYFITNQPPHVNIQDVLIMPTQQASASVINRSGR